MKPPVYASLQYTRGFAAMAVVYFHAVLASVNAFAGRDAALPWVGAFGVDLFFALSGFVMWTSTVGKPVSTLEFYRRRIVRIVPLYWLMTSLLLVMTLLLPQATETAILAPGHVVASYLFLPWPNPGMTGRPFTDLMTPLLVPGWTLNYEMFFYLLFGLVVTVRDRWRFRTLLVGLPLVMLACMALSPYSMVLKFYGSLRLLEFVGGVVLARMTLGERRSIPAVLAVGAVILGVVLLPVVEATRASAHIMYPVLGVASFLVLWGLIELERQSQMPRSRLLTLLGDASFSIYLTHIFAIAALRAVVLRLVPGPILRDGVVPQAGFVLAAMLAAAIGGIIVHLLFERPVTRYLAGRRSASAARSGGPVPVSVMKV